MTDTSIFTSVSVGIYLSKDSISLYAIHHNHEKVSELSFPSSVDSFSSVETSLHHFLTHHSCTQLNIMMISHLPLGYHLANRLSASPLLLPFCPLLHCLSPYFAADAASLSLLTKQRRLCLHPWRGSQYLALQSLTRRRYYLIHLLIQEKTRFLNHIFSQIAANSSFTLPDVSSLFSLLSPEQFSLASPNQLIAFLLKHADTNRSCLEQASYLSTQAERTSFRLEQCPCSNTAVIHAASLYSCISAYEQEILVLDKLILRTFQGIHPPTVKLLLALPGMDSLHAACLLAEIGSFHFFADADSLLRYIGAFDTVQLYRCFFPDDIQPLRFCLSECAEKVVFHIAEDDRKSTNGITRPRLFSHALSMADIISKFLAAIYESESIHTFP